MMPLFRKKRTHRTNSISDELYDAGGKSLGCIGVFEMDFEVFGRKIKHPVRVLQHLFDYHRALPLREKKFMPEKTRYFHFYLIYTL